MELALRTDGALAALRVVGKVLMSETGALSDYLRVARENGAVRCVVDLSECTELPTTIVAVLMREAAKLAEAGGALSLTGVRDQNPFLTEAVASSRFFHYRSAGEAWDTERVRAMATGPSADSSPSRPEAP
jgi:anti-anti-sigma regulatory factor